MSANFSTLIDVAVVGVEDEGGDRMPIALSSSCASIQNATEILAAL
jgi:hypothetical protein